MKQNSLPKISVIIRTYNMANFVGKAIESVLSQTINPKNYEILVVDDGSIDNTGEILKYYKNQIRLIRPLEHLGNIKALNRGIAKTKGEYLIILDADDLFLPDILEKMTSILEKDKNADFVYSDYYEKNVITGRQKEISSEDNIFNSVAGGIMFRKKMLEELGLYDESLIFPEYDLLIKAQSKYKSAYIAQPLYIYQRHKSSITANKEKAKLGKEQLFKRYGGLIKGLRNY